MNLRAFLFRLALVPTVMSSAACFFTFAFLAYSIRGSAIPYTLDWNQLAQVGQVLLVCFGSALGFLVSVFMALIFYYFGFVVDKKDAKEPEAMPATA